MNRVPTLLFFLICAVGIAVAAGKPINPPQFIPINVPGAAFTVVTAINNSGIMTGTYSSGSNCFVLIGARMHFLAVPKAFLTTCFGINTSGAIVGGYQQNFGSSQRGFLYENSTFTDIGPPSSTANANAINDLGQIVGSYSTDTTYHGFLWNGSQYYTIDVPGAVSTYAAGINNDGLVVLQWVDSQNRFHSSIYDGTNFTSIDVPGADDTMAYNINSLGDIAITYMENEKWHSALFKNRSFYNFIYPGFTQCVAYAINDHDDAGGFCVNGKGTYSGYKLIP